MGIFEILITSVGLSMDACAVAVCKGLSMNKLSNKKGMIIALYFGIFQGLMPLIGYLLGMSFQNLITSIDHWIAFVSLGLIGFNMLSEGISSEGENVNDKVDFKTMFPLAIATSIDALAVGITFAFLKVNILIAVISISIITFVLSFVGVIIGNKFGSKFQNKAQILGGIILMLMGLKILIEHLNIL